MSASVRLRITFVVCFVALQLATAWRPASSQIVRRKRPNLVIILADDLGYGDLSAYGAKNRAKVNELARLLRAHIQQSGSVPWQRPAR